MIDKVRGSKAFTLIELIVVIGVIGILVLIASSNFSRQTEKAKLNAALADMRMVSDATQIYNIDTSDWPRLTDAPYTSDELEAYGESFYDSTGLKVDLEDSGNYYNIDYDKLSKYAKAPVNKENYILQNPVGKVFYIENITEDGKNRVDYNTNKQHNNNNPSSPVVSNVTDVSVVVNGGEGLEVKLDNGEWFSSPHTFTGLLEGTRYEAFSRYKESESMTASKQSLPLAFETDVIPKAPFSFNYKGSEEKFTVPTTGVYKLEVWGAEGGGRRLSGNSSSGLGGYGGYATGETTLTKGDEIYIHVGGSGRSSSSGSASGGYNGGGSGYASSSSEPGNGGGGATDIRTVQGSWSNSASLNSRFIIAGGGGGGGEDPSDSYGHGGGLNGSGYSSSYDASQNGAGSGGSLGRGGSTNRGDGGGGGGGYYGGGTYSSSSVGSDTQGGGGGSAYISGLSNSSTRAGNQSMTNPSGGTMTGRTGNGTARITFIRK